MINTGTKLTDRWQNASKIFTLLALILGLAGLFEWLLFYYGQSGGYFAGPTMKANTASGILLSSICLGCLHFDYKRTARLGIILLLAIALFMLADHLWQLHLGVDQWLLPNKKGQELLNDPARLLVLRAALFFLLATALLCISFKGYNLGQLLAAFIFIVAYVAIIDNIFSISRFPDHQKYIIISNQAALAFLLLSLALLLYCPSYGWMKLLASNYAGGMLARYTFAYFLLVSPVLIGFYLHSLGRWQFSPGLAILSLFLLTCTITLPVTYYYLKRLNKLDAQLKRANQNLQTTNKNLFNRNQALSTALADVRAGNRELAVMTKEVLLSSQTLELKNNELLRLNKSLDYIVQMAGHDLKTPVFNLELLFQKIRPSLAPHLSVNDAGLLDMVETSITSLKRTIDGLGQIIRSQQILIGLQVSVSFAKLLQEIQTELAREIKEANATINLNLAVDNIVFSRLHLHSIFLNLLSNALKYRSPDRSPVIEIKTQPISEGIEILFTDNGLGMTADQVTHLFSLFKRFHGHVEGSGIGLYIVKQTIENNGGTILAESTLGAGTRYKISLPQKKGKAIKRE